jgi:hypothetical protein
VAMYVVEGAQVDGAPALFGPFRVEQSARDFANRVCADAQVVELLPPVLVLATGSPTRYNERRPRSVFAHQPRP